MTLELQTPPPPPAGLLEPLGSFAGHLLILDSERSASLEGVS